MDIYRDVIGMVKAGELNFKPWIASSPAAKQPVIHRPEAIRKRGESRHRTLAMRKGQKMVSAKITEPAKGPSHVLTIEKK